MAIKTILFDLGNVLLNFSHEKMCRQIAALFDVSTDDVQEVFLSSGIYAEFDRGQMTEQDVQHELEQRFGRKVALDDLRQAAGDIFEPNVEMHSLLSDLRGQGLRLVLLSNTCVTHIEWIRTHYETLSMMDDLVLSYEVGASKPEAEIFRVALEKIQCDPSECLYTDDIAGHIDAGRQHGLQVELFTTAEKFKTDLRKHGIT
ncbi:Alpha-D-glucose-1-phosphate phosphatase YihX [Thalassoglobus neptunius]|uniref:Alpha-D-glucose-1-phosphate phosphatase YihX n=1 Tax=Thalassoglobus neptunius TaxID=1938619 RepID=A0A5C5WX69_9PLAN|nr:HAD family phosphatase [Thalassoglobus neptunius]TWT55316.1 Alpha-D-glucose-1-phosphate phosphatase YihX [Thalassoglobus neptunius]